MRPRVWQSAQSAAIVMIAGCALLVVVSLVTAPTSTMLEDTGVAKSPVDLGGGWTKAWDGNGKAYYYNQGLGLSQWGPPTLLAAQSTGDGGGSNILAAQNTDDGDASDSEVRVKHGGLRRNRHQEQLLKDEGQDVSGNPDWPKDLPGAFGDDTSWVVGMHREPFWSDSQTTACGTTLPCEKGQADRSHKFQRTVNPFTDKRRTFDPYAQGTAEGHTAYPWDPTKDPQEWGTGDCSDGRITSDCMQPLSGEEIRDRKKQWRETYDDWYNKAAQKGDAAAELGDNQQASSRNLGSKKQASTSSILTIPQDFQPWAHGNQAESESRKYAGGRPMADSFNKVLKEVKGQILQGKYGLPALEKMEQEVFKAREARQQLLYEELQHPTSLHQSVLNSVGGVAREQSLVQTPSAKTKNSHGVSIWESPLAVAEQGLFGSHKAAHIVKLHTQNMAKTVMKGAVRKEQEAHKGPLPSVKDEVAQDEAQKEYSENVMEKKDANKAVKPWQQQMIQRGTLQRQNTAANLNQAVRVHDHSLLKKMSGMSWKELQALEKEASDLEAKMSEKYKTATKAHAAKHVAKQVDALSEKEIQQGTLRRESVKENLKHVLDRREVGLLEKRAGWKNEADLTKAEEFAENLEDAIAHRRNEEKSHPLIPLSAEKALQHHQPNDKSAKMVQERKKIDLEQKHEDKVLQRMREVQPLVKAYEAQVRYDEKEYSAEVAQERQTLSNLHRDQTKLAKELQGQEDLDKSKHTQKAVHRAPALSASDLTSSDNSDSSDSDTGLSTKDSEELQEAALAGGQGKIQAKKPDVDHHESASIKVDVPPSHGLSAGAADSDLDSYFAKQQVSISEDDSGGLKKGGAKPAKAA